MHDLGPGELTAMLDRWRLGDPESFQRLIPLVYQELHGIARGYMSQERQGHTLGATGLVHEAFLRLSSHPPDSWRDRRHFYGVAARLMRQILVDHARRRAADKRQAKPQSPAVANVDLEDDYVMLDRSLTALEEIHPRKARIIEYRYFGGLTLEEIADAVDLSRTMVAKELRIAQLWLHEHMRGGAP